MRRFRRLATIAPALYVLGLLIVVNVAGCQRSSGSTAARSVGPAGAGKAATHGVARKPSDQPVMPRATHRLPQFNDIQASPHGIVVSTADQWSELFRRQDGWTGADGVYSMPLSGRQAPPASANETTLLTFGDTILGHVDPTTHQRSTPKMVHFSHALLHGAEPSARQIEFFYPAPDGPDKPLTLQVEPFRGWRFWLQDGMIHDGHYYTQAMAVRGLTEDYPWWTRGTVMLKVPLDSHGPRWRLATQRPGAYRYLKQRDALVYFGVAYLEHTRAAGWKSADDTIYIYGRFERAMRPFNPWQQRIELAVARVPSAEFEDVGSWQYWTGDGWSSDIEQVASLGLGGPELSVTPITRGELSGKFLLISKHVRTDLYYRVGETPYGPFGPPCRFYSTTEEDHYGYPAYTYNAKAHPHLSSEERLLVSYNVNCSETCFTDGDLYRPRFVWLEFPAQRLARGAQDRGR